MDVQEVCTCARFTARVTIGLPLWLLLVIFVAAGGVIWIAGIQLSKPTDVLDARLHLGSALGGLIVLAVATDPPEIAITVTAAASGSVQVAVGNILGGIAPSRSRGSPTGRWRRFRPHGRPGE